MSTVDNVLYLANRIAEANRASLRQREDFGRTKDPIYLTRLIANQAYIAGLCKALGPAAEACARKMRYSHDTMEQLMNTQLGGKIKP